MHRVHSDSKRWFSAFRRNVTNSLQDTRKFNAGRPTEKELSLKEKYEKLQANMLLLEAENEL